MAKKIKQSTPQSSLLPPPQVITLTNAMRTDAIGANRKHPKITASKGKTRDRRKV